jgi:FkbM family methyltransferase
MIITKNIFSLLEKYLPSDSIIIEAGAFDGRDTKKLSALLPNATIHAFEPVPEIFAELTTKTSGLSNIYCYQIALSDKTGTTTFYVAENPKKPGKICQAGTLMVPKERLKKSPILYPRTINISTITVDDWAQQNNIKRVDFMWLDLQGHELAVLKAAPQFIQRVRFIFLEVNFIEAYHDQPTCQEIDEWLKNNGFEVLARDFEDENRWFFGAILYARIVNSD